ncbi:hypothetical protein [Anaeromicrobium sediminis]|uniref:hypothetical protein n=1 Tax=Anaeromicrobium sediminis TaxID=1478221 RepID=UPI0011401F39|nr:hypothetical protein [Anaeromicrobium sediminis]
MDLSLQDLDEILYNNMKKRWQFTDGDCDILVRGDSVLPNIKYLELARVIISDIDMYKNMAIDFMETFLNISGKWYLFETNFGCIINENKYEFSMTFSYEDDKYVNTYFVVYFRSQIIEPRYKGTKAVGLEIGFY